LVCPGFQLDEWLGGWRRISWLADSKLVGLPAEAGLLLERLCGEAPQAGL
jgi:hypothetical protein